VLRDKASVETVLKLLPEVQRSHLWSFPEAQAFLAALGTVVETPREAAQELAYCLACAGGVPTEDRQFASQQPQQTGLPPGLRNETYS
jgi:hypothetical protein